MQVTVDGKKWPEPGETFWLQGTEYRAIAYLGACSCTECEAESAEVCNTICCRFSERNFTNRIQLKIAKRK